MKLIDNPVRIAYRVHTRCGELPGLVHRPREVATTRYRGSPVWSPNSKATTAFSEPSLHPIRNGTSAGWERLLPREPQMFALRLMSAGCEAGQRLAALCASALLDEMPAVLP